MHTTGKEEENPLQAGNISRRKMLTTSLTALAGVAAYGNASTLVAEEEEKEKEEAGAASERINFSLKGKSAVVTGAARGIGRAIAIALAQAGADVMGIDMAAQVSPEVIYKSASMDDLHETGSMVKKYKRRYVALQADTRDMAAMRAAADQAVREFGKVDILVGDAGIQIFSPLAEMNDKQWQDVINVNLTGTANTLRAFLPHMISRKYGRIILVSSGQGRHGMRDGSAYSASKWGIIGLMKSVALEVAEYNITVNTMEPGLVDTDMTRNPARWKEALKEAGKPVKENPTEQEVIDARLPTAVQKIPWMKPEDVAPVVVFLASDAAYRVTGSTYDATSGDSAKYTG
jgi:NAD(P)-dependent dehydrogenase (short-subunit alcohol dehydrogenase family)